MSCFDKTHRDAIDAQASKMFQKGVKYEHGVKISCPHWDICPPFVIPKPGEFSIVGLRCGRMVCIGKSPAGNRHKPAKWIVRCDCGAFETRSARVMRNPENFGDRCAVCRKLAQIKRSYHFAKTGEELDAREL